MLPFGAASNLTAELRALDATLALLERRLRPAAAAPPPPRRRAGAAAAGKRPRGHRRAAAAPRPPARRRRRRGGLPGPRRAAAARRGGRRGGRRGAGRRARGGRRAAKLRRRAAPRPRPSNAPPAPAPTQGPGYRARRLAFNESLPRLPAPVSPAASGPATRGVLSFSGILEASRYVEGGAQLGEFSVSLFLRSRAGCLPYGWHPRIYAYADYDRGGPWHVGGCSLLNAVVGRTAPAAWRPLWRKRRACCPAAPEDELFAPGGLGAREKGERARVKDVLWNGPRSDWGLSLSETTGRLLFGVGHRDYVYRPRSGRPVRDETVATTGPLLVDDAWHSVVAVRRRRAGPVAAGGGAVRDGAAFDKFQDSELLVYVDGARGDRRERDGRAPRRRGDGGGDAGVSTGRRGAGDGLRAAPRAVRRDAPRAARPALPRLPERRPDPPARLDGARRRRVPREAARGRDAASRRGHARGRRGAAARGAAPIPVYYLAHTDAGSLAMRDAFVASVKDAPGDLELREVLAGDLGASQKERYGPKGQLIHRALTENPAGTLVVVADIDIRFFRPLAPLLEAYAERRSADAVFQRDADWSLEANLGLMALRCSARVDAFFAETAAMAATYGAGDKATIKRQNSGVKGGDQRIVNVALKNPARVPALPAISWALLPHELTTRTIDLQRGMMYKHEEATYGYHLNDFGGAGTTPEKARENKMAMLAQEEAAFKEETNKAQALLIKYAQHPPPWD
ncbi:hypothetical protein JL722_305 [Aureococcus anophagefferens]|nr:hypothetical protein JL722_305 [Aureococcus anophagefferens]